VNDRTDDLQRRLQQATAPECPADECRPVEDGHAASVDAETASLREGWLALGQLLEAAQPMSDASTLERRLPLPQASLPQAAPSKASPRWKASIAAAMAASLVIGATLAWNFLAKRSEIPSRTTQDVAVEDTDDETSQPATIAAENAVAAVTAVETPIAEHIAKEETADELQWDDSLDDQLALVSQEIMQLEGDWDSLDDAFTPVWEGIDQVEQDIEQDTL